MPASKEATQAIHWRAACGKGCAADAQRADSGWRAPTGLGKGSLSHSPHQLPRHLAQLAEVARKVFSAPRSRPLSAPGVSENKGQSTRAGGRAWPKHASGCVLAATCGVHVHACAASSLCDGVAAGKTVIVGGVVGVGEVGGGGVAGESGDQRRGEAVEDAGELQRLRLEEAPGASSSRRQRPRDAGGLLPAPLRCCVLLRPRPTTLLRQQTQNRLRAPALKQDAHMQAQA